MGSAEEARGKFHSHPRIQGAFTESGPENWEWAFLGNDAWWIDVHVDVAKEVGAYIVPMAWSDQANGPEGYLKIGLLGSDSFHLSSEGHKDFANRVKKVVDRVGVSKNPRICAFQSVDFCLNWFQSGVVGGGLTFGESGTVEKMPNTEKYAMSFREGKGYIELENPTDELLHLFVAYMTQRLPIAITRQLKPQEVMGKCFY